MKQCPGLFFQTAAAVARIGADKARAREMHYRAKRASRTMAEHLSRVDPDGYMSARLEQADVLPTFGDLRREVGERADFYHAAAQQLLPGMELDDATPMLEVCAVLEELCDASANIRRRQF